MIVILPPAMFHVTALTHYVIALVIVSLSISSDHNYITVYKASAAMRKVPLTMNMIVWHLYIKCCYYYGLVVLMDHGIDSSQVTS